MNHIGTNEIQTERLILRRFVPEDAQAMFDNWASDPRVTEYLTWSPHTSVIETQGIVSAWCAAYESLTTYKWLIEYNGIAIGGIDVVRYHEQNETAELGYCIGYDYWGCGIVTEAVRAVLRVLFEQVGFHRVSIRHVTDNPGSGRVAEKCGFRQEGIEREAHKAEDGRYLDIVHWALLRDEWENGQARY